jgi:hypothetical protein
MKMMNNFYPAILQRLSSKIAKVFAFFMMAAFLFSCDTMDEHDLIKDAKEEQNARSFSVELQPLNNSGVTGKATFQYMKEGKFEVHIMAKNLAPNQVHPQHIHGFGFDTEHPENAVCPPHSSAGEDGLLTLEESEAYAGPVLIPLDNRLVPLTSQDFPVANENGQVNYLEFTTIRSLITAIDESNEGRQTLKNLALDRRVLELHGAWVKDNMIVSPGTEGAEYIATLPVACGEIKEVF